MVWALAGNAAGRFLAVGPLHRQLTLFLRDPHAPPEPSGYFNGFATDLLRDWTIKFDRHGLRRITRHPGTGIVTGSNG
jgi:hypothetical protein